MFQVNEAGEIKALKPVDISRLIAGNEIDLTNTIVVPENWTKKAG
jgi:hypothetical protein